MAIGIVSIVGYISALIAVIASIWSLIVTYRRWNDSSAGAKTQAYISTVLAVVGYWIASVIFIGYAVLYAKFNFGKLLGSRANLVAFGFAFLGFILSWVTLVLVFGSWGKSSVAIWAYIVITLTYFFYFISIVILGYRALPFGKLNFLR